MAIYKSYQRSDALINPQNRIPFEDRIQSFFLRTEALRLWSDCHVKIGNGLMYHKFALANPYEQVLIECKTHKWAKHDGVPSAKLTTWNKAMFSFYMAPPDYRKIFFVTKDFSEKRNKTLAQYYVEKKSHLIPKDVELWEYDEDTDRAIEIKSFSAKHSKHAVNAVYH